MDNGHAHDVQADIAPATPVGEALGLSARLRPNIEAAPWVIAEVVKLETALALAQQQAEAMDRACLLACPDNTAATVGTPDTEIGRYLLLNENGDELIDTDEPADVVAGLRRIWERVSESAEKEIEALRKNAAQFELAPVMPRLGCQHGMREVVKLPVGTRCLSCGGTFDLDGAAALNAVHARRATPPVDHRNVGVRIDNDWHGHYAAHTFARETGRTIRQGFWCDTPAEALASIGIDAREKKHAPEERDAARYRFWRDTACNTPSLLARNLTPCLYAHEIDEMLDRLMAETPGAPV